MTFEQKHSYLFAEKQYNRFYVSFTYCSPGTKLINLQVLPEGETAVLSNEDPNDRLCVNKNAVLVYRGLDGWLYKGPWQQDFRALIKRLLKREQAAKQKETYRNIKLLKAY